jgi:hypothetical protein
MMRVGAGEECSRLWGFSNFRDIPVFDETLRTKVCCRLKTTKIPVVESITYHSPPRPGSPTDGVELPNTNNEKVSIFNH